MLGRYGVIMSSMILGGRGRGRGSNFLVRNWWLSKSRARFFPIRLRISGFFEKLTSNTSKSFRHLSHLRLHRHDDHPSSTPGVSESFIKVGLAVPRIIAA